MADLRNLSVRILLTSLAVRRRVGYNLEGVIEHRQLLDRDILWFGYVGGSREIGKFYLSKRSGAVTPPPLPPSRCTHSKQKAETPNVTDAASCQMSALSYVAPPPALPPIGAVYISPVLIGADVLRDHFTRLQILQKDVQGTQIPREIA